MAFFYRVTSALPELRDLKVCVCSNTDLGEVLFYDVIFWD